MNIALYICPVEPPDDVFLSALLPRLTQGEQDTARRFIVQHAQRTYIIAHALLHVALTQMGVTARSFAKNSQGKPSLPEQALHFNLSHTEGLVAVALSRNIEIGVDVEYQRDLPDRDGVARTVFRAEEIEEMQRSPDRVSRFFQLWTTKEAVMKATGLGFSLPPKDIGLTGPGPVLTALPSDHGAPSEWWLHSESLGTHWLALASRSAPPRISRQVLKPADLMAY